ncbi:MAG: ribosome maturation factor RimP [Bacteroidota bacterium]
MVLTETKLSEISNSCIKEEDLFLVELKSKKGTNGYQIHLVVDGDNGISIDTCSDISRCINHEIEELGLIDEVSKIEVSSPGLDYPLKTPRQFKKNIGRQIKIFLDSGSEITGKLIEFSDENFIVIETKKKKKVEEAKIQISEIVKTKIIPSFK